MELVLDHLIEDMITKHGFSSYKVDMGPNNKKGDGYLGEMAFLKVEAMKNGHSKGYDVVIKFAKQSDELRKKTPIKDVYNREIFMYTKVFPLFTEFQEENCIKNPFKSFPKCYSHCSNDKKESVILQDLKTLGYELHSRMIPMNLNHAYMVFTNYGKLHAVSIALRHKKSYLFNNLTKDMTDLFGIFITQTNMMPSLRADFKVVMKGLRKLGRMDLIRKYESSNFEEGMEKVVTNLADANDPASVILHGDCWNNNFMFKYEGLSKEQPTDMVFIDFQLTKVASPVFDLSYYFYACAGKEVLPHLHFLLEEYHASLSKCLKEYGINVEEILSYKDLLEHWKKFGKYGLIMSLFIVRIELSDSSEAPDFSEIADQGNMESFLSYEIKNQALYEQRMTDNYIQFAENFL